MEDAAELQNILDELVRLAQDTASRDLTEFYNKMHTLAEAGYTPAIDLFVAGLDDEDTYWRKYCLTSVGFHYKFPPDSELTGKIRDLLLTDPDSGVRIAAACVLGVRSKWPDIVLVSA